MTPRTTSSTAVAAFICSLLGLWIAGIPLGIHARREIDQSDGLKIGRGFATAGIVIGMSHVIIGICIIAVLTGHRPIAVALIAVLCIVALFVLVIKTLVYWAAHTPK